MNKLQVAKVPVDARLLREETSRDPILSRVVHFNLNGWPGKEEVLDNLKSYYFKRNELTMEGRMFVESNTSSDPSEISRIVVSRATVKPSWNCADESVSSPTCMVANTGH